MPASPNAQSRRNSSMACSSIASPGARAAPAPIDAPRPARRRCRPAAPERRRIAQNLAENRDVANARTARAKPRTTSARPRLFLARPCRIRPPRSPTFARLAVAPVPFSGRGAPLPGAGRGRCRHRRARGRGRYRGRGASQATGRRTPRAPLAVVPFRSPRATSANRAARTACHRSLSRTVSPNSRVASAAARTAASSSAVHARPRHPAAVAAETPGSRSPSPSRQAPRRLHGREVPAAAMMAKPPSATNELRADYGCEGRWAA